MGNKQNSLDKTIHYTIAKVRLNMTDDLSKIVFFEQIELKVKAEVWKTGREGMRR